MNSQESQLTTQYKFPLKELKANKNKSTNISRKKQEQDGRIGIFRDTVKLPGFN